jgi:hypothetical protein
LLHTVTAAPLVMSCAAMFNSGSGPAVQSPAGEMRLVEPAGAHLRRLIGGLSDIPFDVGAVNGKPHEAIKPNQKRMY